MLHLKYLIVESASGGIMKGADSLQAREIFFWWEAVMTGMRRQGKGGIIAGFGDIDKTGYLDRLYVHKDYQSQGIATAICDKLEHAFEVSKITTHASITAKPFFLHRGYNIIKEQQVIRSNIPLTNYIMKKPL